jgi:hypothetical protein
MGASNSVHDRRPGLDAAFVKLNQQAWDSSAEAAFAAQEPIVTTGANSRKRLIPEVADTSTAIIHVVSVAIPR